MEEEVIIIDADGSQRNALIVRRPAANPPPVLNGGRAFGVNIRPPAYGQIMQSQIPQVIQVPASAPAKSTAKSWIPDVLDVLAVLTPLPAPPVATGDLVKDFANAMAYTGGLAASMKRTDLMHTVARIVEKRL